MTDPQSAEAVRAEDRAHGQCAQCGRTGTASRELRGDSALYSWPYGGTERYVCRGPCRDEVRARIRNATPPEGFMVPPDLAETITAYFDEHMPAALEWLARPIDDDAPEIPPTRRQQLRNRITGWRERAARRAYKTIAGDWPHNREDDW